MGKAATKPAVKKKPVANSKPKAATRTRGANKLGTSLKRFLQTHKLYDKFDDTLILQIDEIVEFMNLAKAKIKESDISINVSKDSTPYYHRNQNLTIWMDLKKLLNDTLKDNGLTVAQRKEILGKLNNNEDDFEKTFKKQ